MLEWVTRQLIGPPGHQWGKTDWKEDNLIEMEEERENRWPGEVDSKEDTTSRSRELMVFDCVLMFFSF